MALPTWSPATIYAPGAMVQPLTALPVGPIPIPNPNFDSGTTDWVLSGTAVLEASGGYSGANCIKSEGTSELDDGGVTMDDAQPCQPGQSVTFTGMGRVTSGPSGAGFSVALAFFDATDTIIGTWQSGAIRNRAAVGTNWAQATVTAVAPAGTVSVRGMGSMNVAASGTSIILMDAFAWNLVGNTSVGLVFRAVQPDAGLSGSVEPTWPTTNGVQVVDNEVTWEAVYATRVEWTAHPLLVSGSTEPDWPETPDGQVVDGTVAWKAKTREITDPNCPHSRQVVVLAMKVFAGDDDIVRFCATLNAKDWSAVEDAGFLATGMQGANCNGVTVLNQYRGNLSIQNPQVFQSWVADPDPAVMAKIDLLPGIGSSWQSAAQSVINDLVFLSARGFRSVSISGGSASLSGGDVGEPIDPLVRQAIAGIVGPGYNVASAYYPGRGQYLCSIAGWPEEGQTTVFVLTKSAKKAGWSRYVYPFLVDSFAQLGDDLYILGSNGSAAMVVRMVDEYDFDDVAVDNDGVTFIPTAFPGRLAWNFLDNGTPGFTKELESFDYVGEGQGPSFSIAFDQRDPSVATEPYEIPVDTLPGMPYPLPVSAPTMSPVLDFAGGEPWKVNSLLLYFFDSGDQP